LRSRGYSTQRYKTLQTSYSNKPTDLQVASYSVYMIGLVRSGDAKTLESILPCGISPNPCNSFGESLIHNVCRRGDDELLKIFVDNGCALNVCDDYGRTPLHDACWAAEPAFKVVKMILEKDVRLFHMIDSRDRLPLGYVREEDWPDWIDFLESHKDVYWPKRNALEEETPPSLTQEGCNSNPIKDPPNALTIELATLVASGRIKPAEAVFLNSDKDGSTQPDYDSDDDMSSSDGDSDDDDDSDVSENDEDCSIGSDDEMEVLLNEMAMLRGARTLAVGQF
jgi:hypothetical protein